MDLLQRQLRGIGSAALSTILRMSPRPEQTRPSCIEVDRKAFALGIQVNLPVRAPLCRHRPTSDFDAFQDPAEFQLPRVKDPRAVARLENNDIEKPKGNVRRNRGRRAGSASLGGSHAREGSSDGRHWFIPIWGVSDDWRGPSDFALSGSWVSCEGGGLTTRSSSAWMVSLSTAPSEARLIRKPSDRTSAMVNPGAHLPSSYRVWTSTRVPTRNSARAVRVPIGLSIASPFPCELAGQCRPRLQVTARVSEPKRRHAASQSLGSADTVGSMWRSCGDGESASYALGIVATNWAPCPSSLVSGDVTLVGGHQLPDDGEANPAPRGVPDAWSPPESIEDVYEVVCRGCPAPCLRPQSWRRDHAKRQTR